MSRLRLPRRCTAVTRKGTDCKAWAVPGSEPPLCSAHGGRPPASSPGPEENAHPLESSGPPLDGTGRGPVEGAVRPGPCTIEDVIADLAAHQRLLSACIEAILDHEPAPRHHQASFLDEAGPGLEEPLELGELRRLLALHGQNASRLGRLLRDQRALSGEAADGIAGAIAQALDELGTEWQVPL
jgi:hypothetical protein